MNGFYKELSALSKAYRKKMKKLGIASKVEIEPDLVTIFLDFVCEALTEVVYTISPGAGGYDAVCLISTNNLSAETLQSKISAFGKITVDYIRQHEEFKDSPSDTLDSLLSQVKATKITILPLGFDPESGLKLN